MRALTAATGINSILGFTLSALPTSIVEAAATATGDPAVRRSAIEFANAAANQMGVPGQLREAVSALLRQEERLPVAQGLPQPGMPGAERGAAAAPGLIAGGEPVQPMPPGPAVPTPLLSPSRAVADAVGQRIINQSSTADSYAERLRAYIPIEVLSVFITVNSAIGNGAAGSGDLRTATPSSLLSTPTLHGWVAVALLVLSVVAIVAYTRRTGLKARTGWRTQAVISILAFLVWTYAMNASFYMALDIHFDQAVSALCLGVFTLASGFVVPTSDV